MAMLWTCQRSIRYSTHLCLPYSTQLSTNIKARNIRKNNYLDAIGPPDPVSNLRPIIFAKNEEESKLEKEYREVRKSTQIWNQNFWTKHNCKFVNERKEFQKLLKENSGKDSVTADEMSVFYKGFLDKNWRTHFDYNVLWYKQNMRILILEIRVRLSKIKFR